MGSREALQGPRRQQGVPGQTSVLPSGHFVGGPFAHVTVHTPESQSTLHDCALLQSTVQFPPHSIAHDAAELQSTVEPGPTAARHAPFSELQSIVQLAPQLTPQVCAELQSTLQLPLQAATHDCVSLLQSTWHESVIAQSMLHGAVLLHWQLAPLQLPPIVIGVALPDGGAGAPTLFPVPLLPDELQATAKRQAKPADATERAKKVMATSPVSHAACRSAPEHRA